MHGSTSTKEKPTERRTKYLLESHMEKIMKHLLHKADGLIKVCLFKMRPISL